jgi:DNA-binding NtrC family response regulator
MAVPAILVVDEDPDALRDIDQELNDRYARHYRVRSMSSTADAREWLAEPATADSASPSWKS